MSAESICLRSPRSASRTSSPCCASCSTRIALSSQRCSTQPASLGFAGRAAGGNAAPPRAHVVAGRPHERRRQQRRAARRVQRLPAVAHRVAHRAGAERAPVSRVRDDARERGRSADAPGSASCCENALRDFRLAGVALPAEQKQRFKALMEQLATLQSKFDENVLDATNAWSRHVTEASELAGLPPPIVERARAAAQSRQLEGWFFTLDAPNYQAVMMHAEHEALRREFYEGWVTRASDQGADAGRWDNTRADGADPRAAPRDRDSWSAIRTTPSTRSRPRWPRRSKRCARFSNSWRGRAARSRSASSTS